MGWNVRRFRTRAPWRDAQSDKTKVQRVRVALDDALRATQLEIDGLERRREAAGVGAMALLDGSGEYGVRSEADEKDLQTFERDFQIAGQRLVNLRKQLLIFEELNEKLQTISSFDSESP